MINPDISLLAGHNIWQSIIISAVVFIILKVIKDTSAEEKSWSWTATLFALALLPMAAFLPGKGLVWQNEGPVYQLEEAKLSMAPVFASQQISNKEKSVMVVKSNSDIMIKDTFVNALLGVWLMGTLFVLCRLIIAGYNATALRKTAYPFANNQEAWPENVELAISDEINGPIVVGILKPLILMPRNFAYEMQPEELKPLLFHELAHIKRHDNILHLFERIILSIYWWNPVMHFIVTRISEERELACDDRAIKSCGDQLIYAKSLLKGARQLVGEKKQILGLAVLRRESALGKRIKRLTGTTSLEGFNIMRLIKNLSILSMSILLLGLITPRFAIGQVNADDVEIELESEYMLSEQELENIIDEAMSEIPTEEELAKIIEKSMAEMPTEAELAIIIKEATEGLPSEEELARIIEEAIAEMPTEEEIALIIKEAKAEMPSKEELELIIKEALAAMPTKEELKEMQKEAIKSMKKALADEDVG